VIVDAVSDDTNDWAYKWIIAPLTYMLIPIGLYIELFGKKDGNGAVILASTDALESLNGK
jgi:hypothetical protein